MKHFLQVAIILALWATASLVSLGAGQTHQGWAPDRILLDLAVETTAARWNDAPTWEECARESLVAWNTALASTPVQFTARLDPAHRPRAFDGRSSVAFTPDVFGLPFGPALLSVTQSATTVRPGLPDASEADIFLNHAAPFNCYRGAIPTPPVYDLQRTLGHALGHVIGLDHPDPARTVGPTLMDVHPGAVDTLQPPDIQGGLRAAGAAVTGLPFPPRNETLTFYESLETTYRDTLLRAQTSPGYVDAEGVAVWFPEWLRYVLHGCAAPEATTRVLMQIRGQGIQPVCEDLAPEPVAFPPRNLSLDFLTQLDAFYRDAFDRPVAWSHVDQEGKAVWLQEYLRYRIDGQSDTDAQRQVFTQIDDAASVPAPDNDTSLSLEYLETWELDVGTHRPEILTTDSGDLILIVVEHEDDGDTRITHKGYRFDRNFTPQIEPFVVTTETEEFGHPADHRAVLIDDQIIVVYQTLIIDPTNVSTEGPAESRALSQSLMLARFDAATGEELDRQPLAPGVTDFSLDNFPDHCLLWRDNRLLVSTGSRDTGAHFRIREVDPFATYPDNILTVHDLVFDETTLPSDIGNSFLEPGDGSLWMLGSTGPHSSAQLQASRLNADFAPQTEIVTFYDAAIEQTFPTGVIVSGDLVFTGSIFRVRGGDVSLEANPYRPRLKVLSSDLQNVLYDEAVGDGSLGASHIHPTIAISDDRLYFAWSQQAGTASQTTPQVVLEVYALQR